MLLYLKVVLYLKCKNGINVYNWVYIDVYVFKIDILLSYNANKLLIYFYGNKEVGVYIYMFDDIFFLVIIWF